MSSDAAAPTRVGAHNNNAATMACIRFIAKPVLRHRLVTNFTAESENISTDDVIEKLIEDLPEVA